ncbi:phospholipase A1 VesT1.02-like [Homalodisca vitripennis]|uniref:phospholipase A1 VesT1.02-like n=1 Tax=Homalodisca vitripennis TaxID=197043 RepID=UPI001EEA0667|nr:phospholipase A1 VesT1.02-like [Homalodisca vitripennis]
MCQHSLSALACLLLAFVSDVVAEGPLHHALSLGMIGHNLTREDCIWRRGGDRDHCPDPNIFYYLYTPGRNDEGRPHVERLDVMSPGWLHSSHYDHSLDTVVLIHGYAGVTDVLPIGVLRDAYMKHGRHNVFVVDWGELAAIPCYPAAVHNLRPVSRCVAQFLAFLRDSGVPVSRTSCIGHSLGAHVCGVAANYLLFRMHRIIGLDPARPLIKSQPKHRLDASDAEVVQVIHTSSTFGDNRRAGHIDICVNGGRAQPFCHNTTNEQLCSHIRSVCYMAESLDPATARVAVPCTRRCHGGDRIQDWKRHAPPVLIGQNTPDSATGMFCVSNDEAPYCPRKRGDPGSPLCCVPPSLHSNFGDEETTTTPETTIAPTTTTEPIATDIVTTYTINPMATRLPTLPTS